MCTVWHTFTLSCAVFQRQVQGPFSAVPPAAAFSAGNSLGLPVNSDPLPPLETHCMHLRITLALFLACKKKPCCALQEHARYTGNKVTRSQRNHIFFVESRLFMSPLLTKLYLLICIYFLTKLLKYG